MTQGGQDGPSEQTVLEIYKMGVEMADRVSARRGAANAFFVTVESALVAALGLIQPTRETPWYVAVGVAMSGIAISAAWWLQLRSYRDLNKAKFEIISTIEREHLPLQPFTDEWDVLKKDKVERWRPRYAELGTSERVLPFVFAGVYVLMFVGWWTSR